MKARSSIDTLQALGIAHEDAIALRRISMTLHRWHELECGDDNGHASYCIVRGEKNGFGAGAVFTHDDTGKPYLETHPHYNNRVTYTAVPDRERGAHRRLAKIMARYPAFIPYIQTDPRGCALYLVPAEHAADIEQHYNCGTAVHR